MRSTSRDRPEYRKRNSAALFTSALSLISRPAHPKVPKIIAKERGASVPASPASRTLKRARYVDLQRVAGSLCATVSRWFQLVDVRTSVVVTAVRRRRESTGLDTCI